MRTIARIVTLAALFGAVVVQAMQCADLSALGADVSDTAALFQAPDAPLTLDPAELNDMRAYFQGTGMASNYGYGFGRPLEHPPGAPKDLEGSYMDMFGPLGFQPEKQRGKVVIDVGSGLSPAVDTLADVHGAEAWGVDLIFHPSFAEKAGRNGPSPASVREQLSNHKLNLSRRIAGSATRLPFKDDSADVILNSNNLYYLPGAEGGKAVAYELALYEMLRVLRPEGKGYLWGRVERAEAVLSQWRIPFTRVGEGLVFTKPRGFPLTPISRRHYDRMDLMTEPERSLLVELKSSSPAVRAGAERKLARLDWERVSLILEYFRVQDPAVSWAQIYLDLKNLGAESAPPD